MQARLLEWVGQICGGQAIAEELCERPATMDGDGRVCGDVVVLGNGLGVDDWQFVVHVGFP